MCLRNLNHLDLCSAALSERTHPFSKDPWPLPLRGIPLGHMTNLVRHQEQTLKVLIASHLIL